MAAFAAAVFPTPPVRPPVPSHAFLSNLPAVPQQGTAGDPGSLGSCEVQSFGYGLGSYTAASRVQWIDQMRSRATAKIP
jgi:hypothetical protein